MWCVAWTVWIAAGSICTISRRASPTLNWLDPSFAAQRLVMGDALHSLDDLGVRMLRLDANGFLGIEPRPDGPAWSEGHPLSIIANQLIGGLVRKAGGYTFQELNLTVDDIAAMSHGGADLSYDFITRPAYHHALVSGDTEFLRLMLRIMHEQGIDPASLIHALQNHDELTLELVHFWTLHGNDRYTFQGKEWSGLELREEIRSFMVRSADRGERTLQPEIRYQWHRLHHGQRHHRRIGNPRSVCNYAGTKAADPAGTSASGPLQCFPARCLRPLRLGSGGRTCRSHKRRLRLLRPMATAAGSIVAPTISWTSIPASLFRRQGLPKAPTLYGSTPGPAQ